MSQVGTDDIGEMVQDGIAVAAGLLVSAEARGKKVSAGNISYYAVKLLRQGRRSGGQSTTDAMAPGTQIVGRSSVVSLDAEFANEGDGEESMCLHDMLASKSEDPSMSATRRSDWELLVPALDATTRAVLLCLVEGAELTTLVPKLKRCRSALQNDKERLARLIQEHLGEDILVQVQEMPCWMNNVAATRERSACRHERQPA